MAMANYFERHSYASIKKCEIDSFACYVHLIVGAIEDFNQLVEYYRFNDAKHLDFYQ